MNTWDVLFRRACWLLLGVLIVSSTPAALGFEHTSIIETDPGSGVRIQLNMPFQTSPGSGFIPIQVKIANERPERLSWSVTFRSGARPQGQQYQFRDTVTVGPMQTRETYLFVPRTELESSHHRYDGVGGVVFGPGVARGNFGLPTNYRSGGVPTAFVAMSKSLAGDSWSKLEAHLQGSTSRVKEGTQVGSARVVVNRSSGRALRGSAVDLAELPADERALAGVSGLFLKDSDWAALAPALRGTIANWVRGGGHLVVVSEGDGRPALPGLSLPAEAGDAAQVGFGDVVFLRLSNKELPIPEAAEAAIELDNRPVPAWQAEYSSGLWKLPGWVGWPQLNVGMIIGFVCVFALVIGPINLRWLAPPSKRHRLFFTVPALSAGASLVLLGVIAVGDGFGGIGARNVMVCLSPGENRLFLIQEQVSRSRLLLRRHFKVDPGAQFAFLEPQGRRNEAREFVRGQAGEMGGDWFRSRAVQSHYLRTSLPSRAEVTLVGAAPVAGETKPPTLLSSVPGSLKEVFFVDAAKRYWYIQELTTGRPSVLAPSTRAACDAALNKLHESLSPNFQVVLKDAAHQPGHFYALAERGAEWPLATLPSITWERETIFVFGPCTQKEAR